MNGLWKIMIDEWNIIYLDTNPKKNIFILGNEEEIYSEPKLAFSSNRDKHVLWGPSSSAKQIYKKNVRKFLLVDLKKFSE